MSYNPDIHHRYRRDAINRVSTIGYDYSQAGMYFVTIFCQDNENIRKNFYEVNYQEEN